MQSEKICLDTSALIELFRDNSEIKEKIEEYSEIYLTPINIIEFGKRKLPLEVIESILEKYLIIKIGYEESILALKIFKNLAKEGDLIEDNDILIAATCILNDIPLLTINKKHFERIKKFGLKLI